MEFMIDQEFAVKCAKDEAAAKVFKAYLLELFKHPELKEDKEYHHYYATRLLRVLAGEEKDGCH